MLKGDATAVSIDQREVTAAYSADILSSATELQCYEKIVEEFGEFYKNSPVPVPFTVNAQFTSSVQGARMQVDYAIEIGLLHDDGEGNLRSPQVATAEESEEQKDTHSSSASEPHQSKLKSFVQSIRRHDREGVKVAQDALAQETAIGRQQAADVRDTVRTRVKDLHERMESLYDGHNRWLAAIQTSAYGGPPSAALRIPHATPSYIPSTYGPSASTGTFLQPVFLPSPSADPSGSSSFGSLDQTQRGYSENRRSSQDQDRSR